MVATHISVLIVLLVSNRIAAPLFGFVEEMLYSLFKVRTLSVFSEYKNL